MNTTTANLKTHSHRRPLDPALSTWPRMRIMLDDPHSTRRRYAGRTPIATTNGPPSPEPRPPGDDLSLRGRLVAAAHRCPPRLRRPDRPQDPARLRAAGAGRPLPGSAWSRPRPGPP